MQIKFLVIFCQWQLIVGHPTIVDSPEIRKNREKAGPISTRLTSNQNAITTVDGYDFKSTTTPSTTAAGLQTIKLTHDDVVMGANSVYGSHFQSPNSQQQSLQHPSGGGILFTVSGQAAAPFMQQSG